MRLQQIAPRCASGASSACLLFRRRGRLTHEAITTASRRTCSYTGRHASPLPIAPRSSRRMRARHAPCPQTGSRPAGNHESLILEDRRSVAQDLAPRLGCTNRWVHRLLPTVCSQRSLPATLLITMRHLRSLQPLHLSYFHRRCQFIPLFQYCYPNKFSNKQQSAPAAFDPPPTG